MNKKIENQKIENQKNGNQKIAFLDIDGTLAVYNRVPLSAVRACRKARQNGHILYICTGRSRVQISPGVLKVGFDGVVSSGGAHIEIAGKTPRVLFQASFEKEFLRRLIYYLNAHKAPYMLELSDKVLAGPYLKSWFEALYAGKPRSFRAFAEKLFARIIFRDLVQGESYARDDVCKVVFMEPDGLTFEDVRQEFQGSCELFRNSIPVAGMNGGEISPPNVHKGAALERVRDYYGISRENTIAIGDSDNDRTMLERAGIGIAMGNADEALKQIADDVTDTFDKAGLAKAFKKYGLVE
jgi:Cof subfamily protein (haloacid dehalogenase superfamily)